jgi:hypothetical protein
MRTFSPETQVQVIRECGEANRRRFIHAQTGQIVGGINLLACSGLFTFLIYSNHPTAAAALLGANVLAVIGKFLKSRL